MIAAGISPLPDALSAAQQTRGAEAARPCYVFSMGWWDRIGAGRERTAPIGDGPYRSPGRAPEPVFDFDALSHEEQMLHLKEQMRLATEDFDHRMAFSHARMDALLTRVKRDAADRAKE